MKTAKTTLRKITLLAGLLCALAPLSGHALVTTQRYQNDTDLTNLFLWSDNPQNMSFLGADLSDKKLAGWTVALNTGSFAVLEGPEVKKSLGKFDIEFDYKIAPFTLQFAEVLYNATTGNIGISHEGQLEFNGKKLGKPVARALTSAQITDVNSYFVQGGAVVPVPNSVLLMISAIGFLGVAGRRRSFDVAPASASGPAGARG